MSDAPKFPVTSKDKARWRRFDSIALEVICRVFDDGADRGFEEWRNWRDPGDWLSPQRALGAFIRRRLNGSAASATPDTATTSLCPESSCLNLAACRKAERCIERAEAVT